MAMTSHLTSDIIDCILTSLPDFETLLSTILVSKSFHDVFQVHPGSILTSVGANLIGPEVLPHAVRLAHFSRNEYLTSRTTYVRGFPSEKQFSSGETPIVSGPYIVALTENDRVVRELELFFSTMCKDRESGSRSLLNWHESFRFRRALYRWWLFINLFPPCYLRPTETAGDSGSETEDETDSDSDISTDDDTNAERAATKGPGVYLAKSNDLRKEFLSEFPDDEVAQMWQIHNFMMIVSVYIRNATSEPVVPDHLLLWNGPSAAAEAHRALRSFNKPKFHFKETLNWDYAHPDEDWPGFSTYLQNNNYDTSQGTVDIRDLTGLIPEADVILDSGVKATEACDGCHVLQIGPNLWSSSNWYLLTCVIVLSEMLDNLPGRLGWNRLETQPLVATPWSFTDFVNRHVSPGAQDWSEGKVLCKQCVLALLGRHALGSLREIKAQNGPQREDCWYGYRCRTQRKQHHASKHNHLCQPTRGD